MQRKLIQSVTRAILLGAIAWLIAGAATFGVVFAMTLRSL